MKIKICGMFRTQDISFVNEALPDYIGFVFAESSRKVSPEKAFQLRRMLDRKIKAVGVFVNNDIDFIADLVHNNIIDVVQLHGSEDIEFIKTLRERITDEIPIIKAFSAGSSEEVSKALEFPCDFILLDNGKGGTGKSFDWNLIGDKNISEKIFLAGGICLDNISDAVKLHPFCIDVSSGAETNGIKDKNKITELVDTVHSFRMQK